MEFDLSRRRDFYRARLSAVCALVIACALIPASATEASQKASIAKKVSSAAKKTATAKPNSKRRPVTSASSKSAGTMRLAASKKSLRRKKSRVRGQQKIDSERAQAIQEALIREHYLTGEATGTWNQSSEEAMRRYQADNGWQSKTVPDSRALIKLGLGPSKDHLLNPESAMTTVPDRPKAASLPTTSNSPSPVANQVTPAPASTAVSTDSNPR